ncbi:MAG: aminoacyl-tRNA hydrolase [Alkalispirochaetaceae bacterium]
MKARLLCFLGNPGHHYARTRHNVGWMVEEALPGSRSWQGKFKGRFAREGELYLLIPETYMNKSGESVSACAGYFSIEPQEILVVHDETELPLGTIQLKEGGGTAGHNGLKSIREQLGTEKFNRLRIGVGRPARGTLSSYVLSAFLPEEEPVLTRVLELCGRLLDELISRRSSSDLETLLSGKKLTVAPPG